MNLYTCTVFSDYLIYYFSKEENHQKLPEVWVHEREDKFYIGGNHILLNHFIPNRKGLKSSKTAFSTLFQIQNQVQALSIKEKKKLCILHPSGSEYQNNMIYLNTNFLIKSTPKKKAIK
jgi:hypothetical protein